MAPLLTAVLCFVHQSVDPIEDIRLTTFKDTNTSFPIRVFPHREAWETYADRLRRQVLLSSGLLPFPERCPMNPVVKETARRPDYIIENVYFEAIPGFYVTGNLYRPAGTGPYPGVACPHGHWEQGRLEDSESGSVPARCITLARMGMVAFSYDMIGYNDSCQIPKGWAHSAEGIPEEQRKRLALWAVNPFAIQLWNSVRVLDFLESLPYVDKNRLACTGASGGGTQTFALAAIDRRVRVAAPVNMISHVMQGGCPCENAPILRLFASNVEIGALMAPNPMLMVAATGDWTRDTPAVEFPAVRAVYRLYGMPENVESVQFHADHNYNKDSRNAVYRFFGKWVLNQEAKYSDFSEPAYEMEDPASLRVFPDKVLPEGALTLEGVLEAFIDRNRTKWASILPTSEEERKLFQARYGNALAQVLGVEAPTGFSVRERTVLPMEGGVIEHFILGRRDAGDAIRAALFMPQDAAQGIVLVHEEGLGVVLDKDGSARPTADALLQQGNAVLAVEVFRTGANISTQRLQGSYPDTFMPTDTGYRVQDIVTALAYLRLRMPVGGVVGLGDAGVWALFASAVDGQAPFTGVDANQFPSGDDGAWISRFYVPCIRSIGDLATAAGMVAPRRMLIMNTGTVFDAEAIREVYGAQGMLEMRSGSIEGEALAAFLALEP
jgi:dienelactone hydrolase